MILKEFAAYTREFRRHWLEYLMLFLSLDLLNQFVIIPLYYNLCLAGGCDSIRILSKYNYDYYDAYGSFY
ncbi:hypothetical protein LHEH8_07460 [Lactobacillus helveticus]|uniref:Uncharacterized protein n=1 Tax=Lactobacillus helveticus TaxID=1587 RepID=A0A8H9KGA0_LACHE|nr:hypothetical protein LHEH8_07460 [Lactobacillus helveticus]GFP00269.1 hypothetical protein LHEW6_01020 [Lactobacillus helveticus]GFP02884.1 hypothetical protein LHEY10_08130 [Lactobacillus helveticus]GFP05485.1 hypothetical protein LMG22465_14980 [Lactobacillus helveticus]